MAVRLRLRRIGKKKMPAYQIVAADSRVARDGKFLEVVGRYEPMKTPGIISTREQRLFYWLRHGALPTDTVRSLLRKNGTWMKWSMTRKRADEATIAMEMEKWQLMQVAKDQKEVDRKDRKIAAKKAVKKTGTPEAAAPAAAPAPATA